MQEGPSVLRPGGELKAGEVFVVVATALLCALLAAAYALFPGGRELLVEERGLVEGLTALLLMLAVAVGVLAHRRRHDPTTPALLAIPGLSLLFMLEELSYGDVLHRLPVPTVGDTRLDAVHDLAALALDEVLSGGLPALLAAVAATAVCRLVVRRRRRVATACAAALTHPALRLALIALALLAIAAGTDLAVELLGLSFHLRLLEEALELGAAIALLTAALGLRGVALHGADRAATAVRIRRCPTRSAPTSSQSARPTSPWSSPSGDRSRPAPES